MAQEKQLFVNGKIFTSNQQQPYAEVMAVENGKIQWIGNKADWDEQANKADGHSGTGSGAEYEANRVDLGGKRVLPGIIDAHMHPIMLAAQAKQIPCAPPVTNSIAQLQEAIRALRASQGADKWILGWGYDEGKLEEGRAPNRWDLDAAAADAPVAVVRSCVHIWVVNSMALQLAGIDKNTPDPEGGQIDRDETGEPTGILRETARFLAARVTPTNSAEEDADNMVALSEKLLSYGITGIAEALGDIAPNDYYDIYCRAREKGMKQRVAIYYQWNRQLAEHSFSPERTDRSNPIYVAGVKIIGDGSVSGRTAWSDRPYLNSNDCGLPTTSVEELREAGEFTKKNGIQLKVHAMGEKTMDLVVDMFANQENWTPGISSVRLEHAAMPTEHSMELSAKAGLAWTSQPIFMYAEIESYLNNLGKERTRNVYPYKTMLEKGIKLSFSSDAPATAWAIPYDPFSAMKSAVTRRAYDGTDTGQDQRLPIETVIELYTRADQELLGIPGVGKLAAGCYADFMVLDRDILDISPDEIDRVQVEATYMSGEAVWQR